MARWRRWAPSSRPSRSSASRSPSTRRAVRWEWRSGRISPALTALPRIAEAWGAPPWPRAVRGDIDALYESSCRGTSPSRPPTPKSTRRGRGRERLRAQGVEIGSSTGYTREIMAKITPRAAEQGFAPDSLVCTGDTSEGRPSPPTFDKGLLDLGVWPAWSAIKIDDTTVGIAEGRQRGRLEHRRRGQRQCIRALARRYESLGGGGFRASSRAGAERALCGGRASCHRSVADLLPVVALIEGALHAASGHEPGFCLRSEPKRGLRDAAQVELAPRLSSAVICNKSVSIPAASHRLDQDAPNRRTG